MPADLGEPLSRRERDVLQAMVNGASNKEIASELVISPNTVKVHVRNIFAKMGASSRTEAVSLGMQRGLIEGHEAPPEAVAVAVENGHVEEVVLVSAEIDLPQPITPSPTTAPTSEPTSPRRWLLPAILGVLALLAIAGLLVTQPWQPAAPAAPPEPFADIELPEPGWFSTRPLDTPREGMTLTGVGLTLYQIGGRTADGVSDDVLAFNTRERFWQPMANKPTAVTNATAVEVLGQIYVFGGESSSGPSSVVEVYSPSSDAWRTVASLPMPLANALVVARDEQLYLFGGTNNNGISADAFAYEPIEDTWRPLPAMSKSRRAAVGGSIGSSIYVMGGHDGESELKSCERFSPSDETWANCPPMLEAREGADAVELAGKLYVIGGGTSGAVQYGEVLDGAEEQWQVLNVPLFDSAENLINPAVSEVEAAIYIVGGTQDGTLQSGAFYYQPFQNKFYIPSASSGG